MKSKERIPLLSILILELSCKTYKPLRKISPSTKRCLILSLLSVARLTVAGQSPLFSEPVQDSVQKILVLEKLNSSKRDTIYQGAYVKLWMRTEKINKKMQPLIRMDLNRHTVYYESALFAINDSFLVLLKKPPLPFVKPKIIFDTIPVKQIFGIRGFDKNAEMAISSGITMPAMSFMPADLLTFPWMFVMMPVTQTVSQVSGSIINPTRRIKRGDHQYYKLSVSEMKIDSVYNIVKAPKLEAGQYEWEINKYERWRKSYDRAKQILDQRLLVNNTGNTVLSGTLGSMFFPGYVRGADDDKTKVKIADNAFVFGFTSERYFSPKDRIGIEMQFNMPHKTASMTTNSFSAGAGFINSVFSYTKIGIGGFYSQHLRRQLQQRVNSISADTADQDAARAVAFSSAKLRMEPRAYFLFGIGSVNTTLLKIKGSMASGNISITDYSQKKFAIQSGFGISSRLHKRLLYDMSVKYIWSPSYDPSIGGLKNYSGVKIQFAIGYIWGPAFALKRKMLNEVSQLVK